MSILGPALALIVGLVLGLLGAGGSILTVPIFVYVLGYDPKSAIAMSLGVVGVVALIGFLSHWRLRNVDLRLATIFTAFALAGTFAGVQLSRVLSGDVQLTLFAVVLLAASLAMWRGSVGQRIDAHEQPHQRAATSWPLLGLAGVGVGILTGTLGVGGGFVIVPALVLIADVPMHNAVGTSLLVITVNTLSGFVMHLGESPIDWRLMGWFIGLACVGIIVGSRLSGRVPQARLRQAFSVLLVGVAVYVLYHR